MGFSVKRSIYEPRSVQNLPSFFETPSSGRDLSFGHEDGKNVQNPQVSETSEGEVVQQGTVSNETHATEQPVEKLGKNPPEEGPEVLDISDTEEGLSKTSEAETLSSTGVSENRSEVLDISSEVYRKPVSTQDYGDWEEDW